MNILDVLILGVALAMDACVLTISNCSIYKDSLNKKRAILMPVFFGVFQGVMPLIGYLLGWTISEWIAPVVKYVCFVVFFFLALKILVDIIKEYKFPEKNCSSTAKTLTIKVLLIQALATSIDALVSGITFIGIDFSVYIAVLIIALITFVLTLICLLLGKTIGKLLGKYAEWLGVIMLFALAIKSLIEALI